MKLTITASNRDRFQVSNCPRSDLFIKSIQWQSYTDFELLIADGGSSNYEEIKEYFANFKGPIPMRIVQLKIGEAFERARLNNVGVRNSLGEYIMTTDVDMAFAKDFVKTLMDNVGENKLVESRTMYLKSKHTKMIYDRKIDLYNDFRSCHLGRVKKRTSSGGCQCMHINGWNKIHGFDEKYIGWGSEDFDLYTRAGKAGLKRVWLPEERENILLFHQSHSKPDIKKDLEYQEKNKKILNKIDNFIANPDGFWGGVQS